MVVVNNHISDVTGQVTPQVLKLISAIHGEMDRNTLQRALGLSKRKIFRNLYLAPALKDGLIDMTIPDKPNSRLQKYRLTDKGKSLLPPGMAIIQQETDNHDRIQPH
jgi:DNA-binding HxlR family transcriptional regulator